MTPINTPRTRTAPRRRAAGLAAAAAVAISVSACDAEKAGETAPTTPRASATQTTIPSAPKVSRNGIEYVVAPPLGTESSLTPTGLAGLDRVDPATTLKKPSELVVKDQSEPRHFVRAVFLKASNGNDYTKAASFQPVYVLDDGSLVGSGLELNWVTDGDGNRSLPLSAATLRFTTWAAFPQPGQVAAANLRTGETRKISVPSQTIERVRWIGGDSVVASGDDGAWLVDLKSTAPKAVKLPKGFAGADENITLDPKQGPSLTSWKLEGLQKEVTSMKAPVISTLGQTYSTNLTAATAVSLDDEFSSVGGKPAVQGILAVPLADPTSPRLLVMGESPARTKGCCQVVGFVDTHVPTYSNVTDEGLWLLTWDTTTDDFGRAFLLEANPAVPPVLSYGLNVG